MLEMGALSHWEQPVIGVPFHPKSIGTRQRKPLVLNFLQPAPESPRTPVRETP